MWLLYIYFFIFIYFSFSNLPVAFTVPFVQLALPLEKGKPGETIPASWLQPMGKTVALKVDPRASSPPILCQDPGNWNPSRLW